MYEFNAIKTKNDLDGSTKKKQQQQQLQHNTHREIRQRNERDRKRDFIRDYFNVQ